MKSHWGELCNLAPFHGVRYLSEPKRPLVEKLWWIFVIVICLGCAMISTWEQYQKLINSPIQEFPEEKLGNLSEIPFPAVTICDNRKSFFPSPKPAEGNSDTKLFNEAKLFICGNPHPLSEGTDLERLIMMSPPFNQTCNLTNAFLRKIWSNCSMMFRRIVTDIGVCHTFNMLSPSEIFMEGIEIEYEVNSQSSDWVAEEMRYMPSTPLISMKGLTSPFPSRAENELTVTLYNELLSKNLKVLYCDRSDTLGFKIILHNPHEVPMVGHRRNIWNPAEFNETSIGQYFKLPMERKLELIVEPKLIKANEQLRWFHPNHRNCYFPSEKKLAYFKHYSYSNCELECVTNLTLSKCGCADYYMPKVKQTMLCDRSHLGCILSVLENWKKRGGKNCGCLNSCTLLEYHAKAWYTYTPDIEEIVWNDTSLSVVMGDNVFVVSERKPTFTKVDFYASCGGLFSLFCGISIISVIEILYHCSLKSCCNKFL